MICYNLEKGAGIIHSFQESSFLHLNYPIWAGGTLLLPYWKLCRAVPFLHPMYCMYGLILKRQGMEVFFPPLFLGRKTRGKDLPGCWQQPRGSPVITTWLSGFSSAYSLSKQSNHGNSLIFPHMGREHRAKHLVSSAPALRLGIWKTNYMHTHSTLLVVNEVQHPSSPSHAPASSKWKDISTVLGFWAGCFLGFFSVIQGVEMYLVCIDAF